MKLKNRKGIAMIELIFAIVIMSFVMISLPMLMMQVKESQHLGMKQESIALLASQINLIMTHQWDDVQTRGNNHSFVLKTHSGIAGREFNPLSNLKGTRVSYVNSRLYSGESLFASDYLTKESKPDLTYDYDDIDDFNGATMNLIIESSESASSSQYVDQSIKIVSSVGYVNYVGNMNVRDIVLSPPSGSVGTSTNIKRIESSLTTTNVRANTKIVLRAFAPNIGGYNSEIMGGF